jgi:hypothetical protein
MSEWFYITTAREKDEKERDVSGNRQESLVFFNDDRFTIFDVVPTVDVHELEEDSDDKNDVGVYPGY